jgi:hypothetical protein
MKIKQSYNIILFAIHYILLPLNISCDDKVVVYKSRLRVVSIRWRTRLVKKQWKILCAHNTFRVNSYFRILFNIYSAYYPMCEIFFTRLPNLKKFVLNYTPFKHYQIMSWRIRSSWRRGRLCPCIKLKVSLLEKRSSIWTFSPQTIRSAANGRISPSSIENVGQGSLVPAQMCPFIPVYATNRD